MVMKLFVEAYLRVMLGGTVDVLIERSLKNGVLALVLHTAVGQLDDSTLPTLVVISRLQSTNTILPQSKTKELTSHAAA
jgi:hypothetical protein